MRISKAGEMLAAYELCRLGADITLAAEGRPYDILADLDGRLWKIQVKTSQPKPYSSGQTFYQFVTRHGSAKGHGSARPYAVGSVDVFAFVAIDIRAVIFMPFASAMRVCHWNVSQSKINELNDVAQYTFNHSFNHSDIDLSDKLLKFKRVGGHKMSLQIFE